MCVFVVYLCENVPGIFVKFGYYFARVLCSCVGTPAYT